MNYRNVVATLCGLLVGGGCLIGATSAALADPLGEYSGMAKLGDSSYVMVSDAKEDSTAIRVGLFQMRESQNYIIPVEVSTWGDIISSDLEAVCPVPGTKDQFFMAESGYWNRQFGRVFTLKLSTYDNLAWRGEVVNSFRPFVCPKEGETSSSQEIEGMCALSDGTGGFYMFFGLRGGAHKPGQLVIGQLTGQAYTELSRTQFDLHDVLPGGRSCAELLLVPQTDGSHLLYSVATTDPGDLGPFSSAVCRIGQVVLSASGPQFIPCEPVVLHRLDGLKVEALNLPPSLVEGADFVIGTDDETYGGIVRTTKAAENR